MELLTDAEFQLLKRCIEVAIDQMRRVEGPHHEAGQTVASALVVVRNKLIEARGAGVSPAIGQPREDATQATN